MGHFLAQTGDHFRGCFGGFRSGFDKASHGRFQSAAQAAQVLGDGGFQPGQAFAGGVAAGRFLITQGIQLFAQLFDQAVHAGLLAAE